ncbi:uncharacterized protein LY79DRAFT_367960 [Colletotrichum navitas]|uniref:DUF3108 domain-containing protein n=1 Tax=Colletotrichum navitas TaxID=681940 RepID=A0AAD8V0K5_9PEZI|nr:uncharacterized protein LY79DRAFT_367960 [Colletotrichum navitas]KAK1574393.1 hypothetical protein LY79DRAFT_367960 [Colletotrichum navitas]
MRFVVPFLCLGAALAVAQDPLAVPADFDVEQGEIEVVEGEWFNITLEEFGDTSFDSSLEKRGEMRGTMKIGKTYMDYGCDASIRKTLDEGIRALCDGNGCDGGSSWSRKVKHTQGSVPADATITVRAEGIYKDSYALDRLREGVLESVRPDTTKGYNRSWYWRQPGGWEVSGTCKMSRFANYVGLQRVDGPSAAWIKVYVSIKKPTSTVELAQWVFTNVVGPAVGKKIGNWIGKVKASH